MILELRELRAELTPLKSMRDIVPIDLLWRYTHCTFAQYVLVRYKYAWYSGPLIIIRDEPS